MSSLFEVLSSYVRNNKVLELEAALESDGPFIDLEEESSGNTLLIVAVQNNNKRILKALLRRGASINHRNRRGNTALHFAFAFGYTELAAYLISKGADDSLRNCEGLTSHEGISASSLMDL